MKNKVRISIIVPIYNADRFLDRCMQSIYAQTFTDYEIILVNDGSSDNSDEICKKYQSQDERITYIKKENEGAGSARNAGLAVARGEYVAFPDVDDWFESEMYAELYELAKNGDYDVVISGINYYQQKEDGVLVYSRTDLPKVMTFSSMQECRKNITAFFPTTTIFDSPCNKLYKRSVIECNNLRFTDLRRCQDATFNIDFYNCIHSAASINKAYYNYMENTVADVQRKFPKNLIDISIFYYSHLRDILTEWGVYTGFIKQHYDTSFVIAVYSTINRYDNPRWSLSSSEQVDYIQDILNRKEIKEFLSDSDVRDDAQYMYDCIIHKDVSAIMRAHKKEVFKERMRQNKLLIRVYRKLRGK